MSNRNKSPEIIKDCVDWNFYSSYNTSIETMPIETFAPCQKFDSPYGINTKYTKCPFSPIYGLFEDIKKNKGSSEIYGTCVYIKYKNKPYLVTASHVVENIEKNNLEVGFCTFPKISNFTNTPKKSALAENEERLNDKIDLCVYCLNEEQYSQLSILNVTLNSSQSTSNTPVKSPDNVTYKSII